MASDGLGINLICFETIVSFAMKLYEANFFRPGAIFPHELLVAGAEVKVDKATGIDSYLCTVGCIPATQRLEVTTDTHTSLHLPSRQTRDIIPFQRHIPMESQTYDGRC